uniref:HDC13305 n=1 Tax=Drosophila melanogaster TaxID=7227 RepID=Q6IK62_DROME|nr:TPA_inf: HDC13305 [Drosophila melanogaster]
MTVTVEGGARGLTTGDWKNRRPRRRLLSYQILAIPGNQAQRFPSPPSNRN